MKKNQFFLKKPFNKTVQPEERTESIQKVDITYIAPYNNKYVRAPCDPL